MCLKYNKKQNTQYKTGQSLIKNKNTIKLNNMFVKNIIKKIKTP